MTARTSASLLLAALLVLAQMLLGATPAPAAQPGAGAICHIDDTGSGAPTGQPGRTPDCSLCVLCHAAASGAVLPEPTPGPPARPDAIPVRLGVPRPAQASPGRRLTAACFPTGPPALA